MRQIYDKKTREPAVFSYAAIFSSADDYETGNYVPDGQAAPIGLEPKAVYVADTLCRDRTVTNRFRQKRVNSKCFYTYIFDTYLDISLYEGQWVSFAYSLAMDMNKHLPNVIIDVGRAYELAP